LCGVVPDQRVEISEHGESDRASLFDRPSAVVCDAVALDPDRSPAHPHGLALRCGEPLSDQVCQHVGGEAVGE